MENNILEKNLDCIGRYNPKLKEELLNLKGLDNHFELVETDLKEPNLIYNQIPLHSNSGAEEEAKAIFKSTTNNGNSIHIVFGLGLGFLFKEFCENSKGTVFVYEPNLEILRITLELVDFSKELLQENVFITSDMETFKQLFNKRYTYSANVSIVFLNSYHQIYGNYINEVAKQMEMISGICTSMFVTIRNHLAESMFMVLKNMPYTIDETPLIEFKDVFKGKTALIVSAGPSLDANIETIKKNRDKVIIFCVGTALKALVNNGIKPDFLNIIEVNDCSGQIDGIDLSDTYFILEPYTHNFFHRVDAKKKILFPTASAHANAIWAGFTNVDTSHYDARGTVSYEAITSAKMLGCSRAILVGQDLAFANNQCYSKHSAYSELGFDIDPKTKKVDIKIKDRDNYIASLLPVEGKDKQDIFNSYADYKLNNISESLCFVKGITGELLPTQAVYATFIEHFKDFANNNKNEMELINSSMIGAEITGFKNMPLEEALKDVVAIKDKIELPSKTINLDKKSILTKLMKEKVIIDSIQKEFDKSQDYIFKYELEFQKTKAVNDSCVKYFKLLMQLYNQILNEYGKSIIFQAISFKENIEFQFYLKEKGELELQTLPHAYHLLNIYFNFVGQNIAQVIDIMDKTIKELQD